MIVRKLSSLILTTLPFSFSVIHTFLFYKECFCCIGDIEDFGATERSPTFKKPVANINKRKRGSDRESQFTEEELDKTWREVLGNPPSWGQTMVF